MLAELWRYETTHSSKVPLWITVKIFPNISPSENRFAKDERERFQAHDENFFNPMAHWTTHTRKKASKISPKAHACRMKVPMTQW